jgi:hypothetical protein
MKKMKLKVLAVIISVLIFKITFAQGIASSADEFDIGSPYTIFGLGDINRIGSIRTQSMGIQGISLLGNYINTMNPAALSIIPYTNITLLFNYSFLKYQDAAKESQTSRGNAYGFNISMPFNQNNHWVFTAGVNPYTTVRYKIINKSSVNGESYSQIYAGKGGLTRLNLSMTYLILKTIDIAAEYNYTFGTISKANIIDFTSSSITDTDIRKENSLKGSYFKGGLIIEAGRLSKSKSVKYLTFGFVYESKLKLSSNIENIYRTSTGTDTITSSSGDIEIPQGFGFGISNKFGRVVVSADVFLKNWSDYKENGTATGNFRNSMRAGFGIELQPVKNTNVSAIKRTTVRLGAFYDKAYYIVNNQDVNSIGLNAGINYPLSRYNSIDLGFSYTMRGNNNNGLIKDNRFDIFAGINFGELWFVRPKEE